jgi:hypothetical protein
MVAENQDDLLFMTGISVSSNDKNQWWKWFMPTFYEDSLSLLNLTVDNPYVSIGTLCHIRMIGYIRPAHIQYSPGGTGEIEALGNMETISGFKCYYTLHLEMYKILRVAVYCPVMDDVKHLVRNGKKRVPPQHLCDSFLSSQKVKVRIFAPTKPAYWETTRKALVETSSRSIASSFLANVKTGGDYRALLVSLRDEEKTRFPFLGNLRSRNGDNKRIVTTIQVFRNRITGPMMSLFIVHYTRLGFRVVIYDMFGWHYSFVKDILKTGVYDIVYHPYTMLQIIQPDVFSYEYASNQVSDSSHHPPF